ncbi:TPA: hypothetical protein ACGO1T_001897, partial [Streptococcus suis]
LDLLYDLAYNENKHDDKYLSEFIESLGLSFTTVGYSPWSYVVTILGDEDYASDLWNGYNFYDYLLYDHQGEIIDSCCGLYLPENLNDILDYLPTGSEENLYLVDNEASRYFNDFPKVKKLINQSYDFVAV